MQNGFPQFGGAVGIDAAIVDLAWAAHHPGAADRAVFRHVERDPPAGMAGVVHHAVDFGDHVSPPFDLHPISDFDAQTLDFVEIVQRGSANRRAPDRNRLQDRDRGQFSRAAHLHENVLDLSGGGAGGIFVGDRPTRGFSGVTQFLLQLHLIELDDHAVNFIRQFLALGLRLLDEGEDLGEIFRQRAASAHLESGSREGVEGFRVPIEVSSAVFEQGVGEIIQAAPGGDARLEVAHRSRSGVAGVGEQGLRVLLPLGIHFPERGDRHEQLSPHFKARGEAGAFPAFARNRKRDGAHRADIQGDVLSRVAVPTGNAALQHAVDVLQGERHAVQLEFADVVELGAPTEFVHSPLPVAQLVRAVGIVEREHGGRMPHLEKFLARLAAHSLGGRIGGNQFRMLRLEPLQLVDELVKLGVGDFGAIEHEIKIFVVLDGLAKLAQLP